MSVAGWLLSRVRLLVRLELGRVKVVSAAVGKLSLDVQETASADLLRSAVELMKAATRSSLFGLHICTTKVRNDYHLWHNPEGLKYPCKRLWRNGTACNQSFLS